MGRTSPHSICAFFALDRMRSHAEAYRDRRKAGAAVSCALVNSTKNASWSSSRTGSSASKLMATSLAPPPKELVYVEDDADQPAGHVDQQVCDRPTLTFCFPGS